MILGMASLLLYHATPTNWNAVSSDETAGTSSKTVNDDEQFYVPPASSDYSSQQQQQSGDNAAVDDDDDEDDAINIPHSTSRGENDNAVSISYSCPTTVEEPENLQGATTGTTTTTYDLSPHQKLVFQNTTAYLSVFRTMEYDERQPRAGISYNRVKAGMYEWKTSRFAQNLKDGDKIYESASGIGLNLVMTLEILQEADAGIENLVVYGNDYSADSIRVAKELLIQQGGILSPMHGQLGTFCRADSTKLHEFVPPNAFDLVFTGYITPTMDPLQLNLATQDDLDREYRSICEEQTTRAADMQRRQEDWFGAWVDEMIRIAKPGAPVIVEQVSHPYCEALFDGGGVSQDFWRVAVDRYDWDVDIDSIAFENDVIVNERYHVFMRKNVHNVDASDQALDSSGNDDDPFR